MSDTIPDCDPLMPARAVADYYGVHIGSVGRWVAQDIFPKPDVVIAKRNYWRHSTIERINRQRTIEHAAAQLEDRKQLTGGDRTTIAVEQIVAEVLGSEELRQCVEAMLRDKLADIERQATIDQGVPAS